MEMLFDPTSNDCVEQCVSRCLALLEAGDGSHGKIRALAETQVDRWEYATGDLYPLFDPIGPERYGGSRGVRIAAPDAITWSFGFDAGGRLIIKRRSVSELGHNSTYLHHGENGWFEAVQFDERDDLDFHKCQMVGASALASGGLRVAVTRNRHGDERRSASRVGGDCAEMDALSFKAGREQPVERYSAEVDLSGRPLRIIDPRSGHVFYERSRRNPDELLEKLVGALARSIPKRVAERAGNEELLGVCLTFGDGLERFPPAVLAISASKAEALKLEHEWQVWDPSRWEALVEPIHFDPGVEPTIDKLLPDLTPWLGDPEIQQNALAALRQLTARLREQRWPKGVKRRTPFPTYMANIESGEWQSFFLEALSESDAAELDSQCHLPPGGSEAGA